MSTYKKMNTEPITIEYIEREPAADLEPAFIYQEKVYYLNDFIRTHNNPWIGGDWPEYIHGIDSIDYYNPIYIELIGDEAVNVYEASEA